MTDKTKDVAREIARSYMVLSTEALNSLASILVPMKFTRGAHVLKEGEICDYMYYVERGLVLQYYEKNGKEVTEHISHEGDIVVCIESFYLREPTVIKIATLEPTRLYGIPHDKLFELASQSYEICKLIFSFMQRSLIVSQQKADVLRFESAKERYLRTLKENPDIVRRAPLHYIASLLQMTPETLSRVRTATSDCGIF